MNFKQYLLYRLKVFFSSKIRDYLFAVLIIIVVAGLCAPLSNTNSYHVVSFILLFVVSILAFFMGIGAVLLASTLSAVIWNYFFIPPHFTFHINKTEDILIFGLFFIIALLNGVLTTRIRRQEKLAIEREERTRSLFQFTKELSKAAGINEVLTTSIKEIEESIAGDVLFVLQDGNMVLSHSGRLQVEKSLSVEDYKIAEWVFANNQKAGFLTENFPNSSSTFYPLTGTIVSPGVLVVKHAEKFQKESNTYWDAILMLVSNALEREFLGELAQKARFLDESDRLYKTLFNSISHELRIPVATIMAASDSLMSSNYTGKVRTELFGEIFTASVRLNRLIENLLNMSRLETGRISPRLDWYDINDLMNKLTDDLADELKSHSFAVKISENIPLVKIDFGLIEQVLYNVVFNSLQYSPVLSEITLEVLHCNGTLEFIIEDTGPGFPDDAGVDVFNKFYRGDGSKTGGLGLGLSIVKGFVEAHNGKVSAGNRSSGGANIHIYIPSEDPDIKFIHLDNDK